MRDPSYFMRNWSRYCDVIPPSLPPSTQLPLTASSCGVQQGCLQTQKWGRELNCCQKTPAPLSIWTFHVLIIYEADSWYYVLTNWKSFQTWRTVLTLTLIMIMWHCDTFNIKYRLTFWLWPSLDQVWWFTGMMSKSARGLTSRLRWSSSCWGWWCAAACSSWGCTAPGCTRPGRRWFLKLFVFEKFEEKRVEHHGVVFKQSDTCC